MFPFPGSKTEDQSYKGSHEGNKTIQMLHLLLQYLFFAVNMMFFFQTLYKIQQNLLYLFLAQFLSFNHTTFEEM